MHLRIVLLLLLLCCVNAKSNPKTMGTFLGISESDVQVIWDASAKGRALRRSIRSSEEPSVDVEEEEENENESGSGFEFLFADEGSGDGSEASGSGSGGGSGDGVGDEGSGSGSGDGNDDDEEPNIYLRYWDNINCSKSTRVSDSSDGRDRDLYLPPNYNKLLLPQQKVGGGPDDEDQRVWVWLHAGIQSVAEIDELKGEITLEMDVLIGWLDDVLWLYGLRKRKCSGGNFTDVFAEEQKVLDHMFLDNIWKPDIFIDNLVSVSRPKLLGQPTRLKFSAAQITYTTRVKVKIECQFSFVFYPADTQKCDVVFRSYSHNSSVLQLSWYVPPSKAGIGAYLFDLGNDNFDVAIGSLERYGFVAGGRLDKSNETFDSLKFTISARRRLSYHLFQTYVPSMLYIGISSLCFMVPRRMIEVRMGVVMATLLSVTAMFSSVRGSTPVVSYIKAIDVWMLTCIAFVFAELLQFSLLLWAETRKEDDEAEAAEETPPSKDEDVERDKSNRRKQISKIISIEARFLTAALEKSSAAAEFIEAHPFFLILAVFIVFNVLYWSALLYLSGYFQWTVDPKNNGLDSPSEAPFTSKYPYS